MDPIRDIKNGHIIFDARKEAKREPVPNLDDSTWEDDRDALQSELSHDLEEAVKDKIGEAEEHDRYVHPNAWQIVEDMEWDGDIVGHYQGIEDRKFQVRVWEGKAQVSFHTSDNEPLEVDIDGIWFTFDSDGDWDIFGESEWGNGLYYRTFVAPKIAKDDEYRDVAGDLTDMYNL